MSNHTGIIKKVGASPFIIGRRSKNYFKLKNRVSYSFIDTTGSIAKK